MNMPHIEVTSQLMVFVFVVACLLILLGRILRNRDRRPPLPPGPPPLPLIGNLRDFSLVKPWLTYTRWKDIYGDIVYCQALGQEVIILNSRKAVQDLFEKRSNIYSDRPALPMRDILGWKFVVGLLQYGDEWREHRRVLHQKYRPDAAFAYRPVQLTKIQELMKNILEDPENFEVHYKYMAAATIMSTVYGYRVAPRNDPFIDNGDKAITIMTNSMFPGASLINSLSFLKYLPSWVPGSHFQRQAEECQRLTREMLDLPYNYVKRNMGGKAVTPCIITDLIEDNEKNGASPEGEEFIKGLGATSYSAGADTVACALGTFFLAAATHPEVCMKAREQIISATGGLRLPDYGDRPQLPYIDAIYREVMRWRPAMPMGVAHSVTQDDVYLGYMIPKGTTIMSNIWAMAHDPVKYRDPHLFDPERFLNDDGTLNDDDTVLTFGFGRRVCIGRHAAESTIWATIASILSVFEFSPSKNANGEPIIIEGNYTDALISHALPFRCTIKPYSDACRQMIDQAYYEDSQLD